MTTLPNGTVATHRPVDAATVAAFAAAVVKPGGKALRITPENLSGGWVPIDQALTERCAFAVEPRDGVIALDVDGEDCQAWAQRAAHKARGLGLGVVRVGSGRPGHEHLWLVGRVGWSNDDLRQVAADAGAPAKAIRHGNATRPPLSPHRHGGSGRLIDPSEVNQALAILASPAGYVVPLSDTKRAQLRFGDTNGLHKRSGTVSRSVLTSALALAYVNAGHPYERFRDDLANPVNVAGDKYRALGAAGETWLQALWTTQCRRAKDRPPIPSSAREVATLHEVGHTLATRAWRGQGGPTDRAVYAALLGLAERRMKPIASCSLRRLTELVAEQHRASTTKTTVIRSLGRLRKAGLITTEAAPERDRSTVYRLHPESRKDDTISLSTGGDKRTTNGTDIPAFAPAPDAFLTRVGITAGAWLTFQCMPAGAWVKTPDIRAAHPNGPALETVRAHLHALFAAGLVDHDQARKQSWKRVPDELALGIMCRYAHNHGLAGEQERALVRLDERHDAERQQWNSWSAALAANA